MSDDIDVTTTTEQYTPSTLHRVTRGMIRATMAGVVLALLVLLPLLPGTDAARVAIRWETTTMAVFVVGAVLTVSSVAFALVRATRRSGH